MQQTTIAHAYLCTKLHILYPVHVPLSLKFGNQKNKKEIKKREECGSLGCRVVAVGLYQKKLLKVCLLGWQKFILWGVVESHLFFQ